MLRQKPGTKKKKGRVSRKKARLSRRPGNSLSHLHAAAAVLPAVLAVILLLLLAAVPQIKTPSHDGEADEEELQEEDDERCPDGEFL